MTYSHKTGVHAPVRVGWVLIGLIGLMIGMSLGLYIAARTLPMNPPIQYIYLQGKK